jgi:flagellar export protein FliJ
MKKFQFRLQVVERHRKLQEQEKQVWLAKCIERMRKTEASLLDLDMKEVQARREFAALGAPGRNNEANSAKFWMLDQFIKGQKIRRTELKQTLALQEQEVAQAYRDFLKASQQRKIMEKLHEKRKKQFMEEVRKADNRKQDEQYVMRAKIVKLLEEVENEE